MKIIRAKTAGFCMGVRRAMDIAVHEAQSGQSPVYTYGPLIHNRQVVESLREQGVMPVDNPTTVPPGHIVIRAHGIPIAKRTELDALGFYCIDATCPHVTASQKRIASRSAEGFDIILVGDRDHAEVVGLEGHAATPVHIISSLEEAQALSIDRPFCVIAQTTFNLEEYEGICAVLRAKGPKCIVYDSICRATEERQNEVRDLTRQCDAIVVVGGKHSANSCRLAQISTECGKPTFFVETAEELDMKAISVFETVGITAGASTPDGVIADVVRLLTELADSKATGS